MPSIEVQPDWYPKRMSRYSDRQPAVPVTTLASTTLPGRADEPGTGGLKPYLLVRGRLEALVARPLLYEMAALGEEVEIGGIRAFAIRSGGLWFPIMPAAELARQSA